MLGGGAPGKTNEIVVYVVTQQGRRLALCILLAITSETGASIPTPAPTMSGGVPGPPNATRLPSGLILTDDNGKPFLIAINGASHVWVHN